MWVNGRYIIKAHRVTPIKHGFTNHDAPGFRVGALQVACFRCIQAVREWVSLDWRPKHIYNAPIYFHEIAVLKIIMDLKQILRAIKNIFSIPVQVECAQLYQGMAAEVLHPWSHTQCKIRRQYWFRNAVKRTARKMHKCYCHYLWQRCKHDKSRVALLWSPVSGCPEISVKFRNFHLEVSQQRKLEISAMPLNLQFRLGVTNPNCNKMSQLPCVACNFQNESLERCLQMTNV